MSVLASASVSWPPMLATRASVLAMRACKCRLVLLQRGDLFLVLFVAFIEGGKLGVHLSEELLALGLEFVATEALELELVLQFVGQGLEFGFALLDAFLKAVMAFSCACRALSSFLADSPVLSLRSSISSLRAFLMTAAVTVSSSSGS